MKCRIYRDFDTDAVTSVLNEQGQESSLYREALSQVKDQEEALDIWSVASLPRFKEFAKDLVLDNSEPRLQDVMKFINNLNTNEKLSSQDLVELFNNIQTLNIENADSLLNNLQDTFFNGAGVFSIERQKLIDSGLYSEAEISNMMTYPSVRIQTKEFINKLRNTLRDDSVLDNMFSDNSSENDLNIQDSSVTIGLGKFRNYVPSETTEYILSNIRNYTTDSDFTARIQALDNVDIKDYILDNPTAFNIVKDMVMNSKIVPVFTEVNGIIVPKLNNDLVPSILNTLRVGESKLAFTEAVDNIRAIPTDDWYNNEAIPYLLKDLELEAARNHIDIYGLSNSYTSVSQEEIGGILDVIDDFLYKAEQSDISNADIYDLSNDISEFFGQSVSQEEKSIPISESDKSRNLSILDTAAPELNLYESDGYIKFRDNLYQKATVYDSFDSMVTDTYNALLQDMTILPDSVLESLGLKTNGNYNLPYLLNPSNEANIKSKINNFVSRTVDPDFAIVTNNDFDLAKQVTLYKNLLNVPAKVKIVDDISQFMTRKSTVDSFQSDIDYLTSDFISDFYTGYLEQKVLETPLFDSALKYFEVTNKGIIFNSTDPTIKNQTLALLQEESLFPMLQAYASISKDSSMEFLLPQELDETTVDIQDRRDFVLNNPQTVDKFLKPYTRVDTVTAVVKNGKDEFIQLNDGIYELSDFRNGVSVYSKLGNISDPNYYVFNMAKPVVNTDINIETFESTNSEIDLTDKSKVSQAEANTMKESKIC